jgi:hypothetical protein
MARHRKSPSGPARFVFPILILCLAAGGFVFFRGSGEGQARTIPLLEPRDYLDNALALRGNTYRLQGVVDDSLVWTPGNGRLISVQAGEVLLPVVVPREQSDLNIQKAQRLEFVLEVDEEGLLRATKVTKS